MTVQQSIQPTEDPSAGRCVEWPHARDAKGYGRLTLNKKQRRVHRFVFELMHGPIPKGLVVRHKCDNRSCYNLDHLEIGTAKENSLDMVKRERHTGNLESTQVKEIRERLKRGEVGERIAEQYGIASSTVSAIKSGQIWNHTYEQG